MELRKQMGERITLLKVEIGDFVEAALLVRGDGGRAKMSSFMEKR